MQQTGLMHNYMIVRPDSTPGVIRMNISIYTKKTLEKYGGIRPYPL